MTTPLDRAESIADNTNHPAWDTIAERIADDLSNLPPDLAKRATLGTDGRMHLHRRDVIAHRLGIRECKGGVLRLDDLRRAAKRLGIEAHKSWRGCWRLSTPRSKDYGSESCALQDALGLL